MNKVKFDDYQTLAVREPLSIFSNPSAKVQSERPENETMWRIQILSLVYTQIQCSLSKYF